MNKNHLTRIALLEYVYQFLMLKGQNDANEPLARNKNLDLNFYLDACGKIASSYEDEYLTITTLSSRSLDIIETAIILIGIYEINHKDTPFKVVINEAIILAKQYAGEKSYKFINAILDKYYVEKNKKLLKTL